MCLTVYAAGKLANNKVYFIPKEINKRSSIVASPDRIGWELQFFCQQGTCKQEPNCEEPPHMRTLDTCFNDEQVSD
jgi:hypothetical protein